MDIEGRKQAPKPLTYTPDQKVLIFWQNKWQEGEIVGGRREYVPRRGTPPHSGIGHRTAAGWTREKYMEGEHVELYSAKVGSRYFPKLRLDRIRPIESKDSE